MNKKNSIIIIGIIILSLLATAVLAATYTKFGNVDIMGWLQMNNQNISNVQCMIFNSTGQICSGI